MIYDVVLKIIGFVSKTIVCRFRPTKNQSSSALGYDLRRGVFSSHISILFFRHPVSCETLRSDKRTRCDRSVNNTAVNCVDICAHVFYLFIYSNIKIMNQIFRIIDRYYKYLYPNTLLEIGIIIPNMVLNNKMLKIIFYVKYYVFVLRTI